MNPDRATVYVVDDDPSMRRSIGRLLRASGYDVDMLNSAEDFLQCKVSEKAECLVLDLRMPGRSGLELQEVLAGSVSRLPIVFISGYADVSSGVRAMKQGAVDFLTKPFDETEFLRAVEKACARGRFQKKELLEQRSVQSRASRLTPRERQVYHGVISGKLNKQIAFKLGISEKTVKVHRARVMEKMRVRSVAELVRMTERTAPIPLDQSPMVISSSSSV